MRCHGRSHVGPTISVLLVVGALYVVGWVVLAHLTSFGQPLASVDSSAAPAAAASRPLFDVHDDRRSHTRLGAPLPPVPDVAVSFNCWGSESQQYLAFPSIARRINASSTTYIHITSAAATLPPLQQAPCDVVSNALFEHLSAAFPCATVVYRRHMCADAARALLRRAPTVVCASAPLHVVSAPNDDVCSQLSRTDDEDVVIAAAPLPHTPAPQPSFVWFLPRAPPPPPPPDALLAELRRDSRAATVVLGNRGTTVVTAFYRISSKYSLRTYDAWINNFMAMGFRCVVYGDDDAVAYLRASWPATADRVYVVRPLHAFTTARWDWSADEDRDPEQCVGHSKVLYQIWNEKPFLVADTARRDPFRTATFAWVDIGCFREPAKLPHFRGFPDATKVDRTKVTFLQIEPFRPKEKRDVGRIDGRFARVNRIGGGIFMGDRQAVLRFADLHAAAIDEAKASGVFAGKDQSLFAFNILRHPEALDTALPEGPPGVAHDRWMMLQLMWASAAPARPTTCLSPPQPRPAPTCDAFFLILSTAADRVGRDAIRRGWLTDLASLAPTDHLNASAPAPLAFTHKFILGHPHDSRGRTRAYARTRAALADEARQHGDLLLLPFVDDYWNLTVKVGLALKWPSVLASGCRLLVKVRRPHTYSDSSSRNSDIVFASHIYTQVDADVHIRAERFAAAVAALPPAPVPVYGGWVYDQVHVISEVSRDPHNRHSLTVAEHPDRLFEPYAGGPVYFLSRDVAAALPYDLVELVKSVDDVEVVPDTYLPAPGRRRRPAVYKLEDAYLGTLVRRIPNASSVQYVHVPRFFADARTQGGLVRDAVVVHGLSSPEQVLHGRTLFN